VRRLTTDSRSENSGEDGALACAAPAGDARTEPLEGERQQSVAGTSGDALHRPVGRSPPKPVEHSLS